MDFADNEEQSLLRSSARRFAQARSFRGDQSLAAPCAPGGRWNELAELGWLGLPLAEDVGGLSLSPIEVSVLMEEFGRGLVIEPFVSTVLVGALMIDRLGETAQRQSMLPRVINGELKIALAHDESGTRGNPGNIATTATRQDEDWTLTGCKRTAIDGPTAGVLLVSALVPGEGLSVFLVDPQTVGVSLESYRTIDGFAAADISFENARGTRLSRGDASAVLKDILDETGVALAAEAIGGIERVMALTAEFLKTRRQFGSPLAKLQAIRHRMAEMAAEAEMARSALHYGLWGLAQTDRTARRRAAVGSTARVLGASRVVCENAIQLHGGIGMTDACEVGHHYRRLLAISSWLGGEDILERRLIDARR